MSQDSASPSDIESPTPGEFDWAVVNSLLEAQSHTNASLERYLLYITHDDFDIPTPQVEQCLEQAISSQERALEDLEAAKQFVEQYEE